MALVHSFDYGGYQQTMFGMFAPVVSSGVMNSSKHQRGPSSSYTASGASASSSRTRRVLTSISTTIPVSSSLSVSSCAIASLAAGVFGRLRRASFWLVPSTMQQNPLTLPEYPVTRYFMFPSFLTLCHSVCYFTIKITMAAGFWLMWCSASRT